ncbi:hypothetical protein MRX96_040750 [Rhipicephalus microplus]
MLCSLPTSYDQLKLQLWWIPPGWQRSELYRKVVKYLHEELGHAWCSASADKACRKALFQWLVPNPLEAFQHPYDRDVSLSSISFGTLVQLGVFVQHKLFSSTIVDDHCNSTRRSVTTSACCMPICTSTTARAAQGRSPSTGSSCHT